MTLLSRSFTCSFCALVLVSMSWMPTVKAKGLQSSPTLVTRQCLRVPQDLGFLVGTNWTLLRPTLNRILTSPGLSHFLYQVTLSQRYSCWYSIWVILSLENVLSKSNSFLKNVLFTCIIFLRSMSYPIRFNFSHFNLYIPYLQELICFH